MKAELSRTNTPDLFHAAVKRAADLLRRGQVVALPTETVYGLAANALDRQAVAEIFRVKQRPANNPIIVHVDSLAMANYCAREWPPIAGKLAQAFWPGPLTMVLPRAAAIPDIVTAGGDTVGLRWPSHPFVQAVITECGFPLAAPSANPSNQVSPTTADHVLRTLGERIPLVVDGGPSHVGIESTVIDLSVVPPSLLRPGMISEDALGAVVGAMRVAGEDAGSHKSPGRLPRHYSPKAELLVGSWRTIDELRQMVVSAGAVPDECHVITTSPLTAPGVFGRVTLLPREPAAYARALYAELHHSDVARAGLIVVEAPPKSPAWRAIADRLRRAAHKE